LTPHIVPIGTLVCLKDFTFLLIHKAASLHQLWNDTHLRTAMATASAGRLL